MELLVIVNAVLILIWIKNKIYIGKLIEMNSRLNAKNAELTEKVAQSIGTISSMRQYPN